MICVAILCPPVGKSRAFWVSVGDGVLGNYLILLVIHSGSRLRIRRSQVRVLPGVPKKLRG